MKEFVQAAVEAAREAGEILAGRFGGQLEVERKGPINYVTEVDRNAEEAIRDCLRGRFPHHAILGEESGGTEGAAEYRWVIDPLDGTTNYVHGLDWFAVSIALERAGELVVGAIYAPLLDELYLAELGGGAYLIRDGSGRGLAGGSHRLAVSDADRLLGALVATGFPYEPTAGRDNRAEALAALGVARDFRRFGSASLDLAAVARGRFDAYWEWQIHPWDIAAGVLLVTEAGGRVSGSGGAPFRLEEGYVLATNGHLHDELATVLGRALEVPERSR
jgi:myo-inositol-1(or 4)-monophosphatase